MSKTYLRTSSADGEQYLEVRTANGLSQYWWNDSNEPIEPQPIPPGWESLGFTSLDGDA